MVLSGWDLAPKCICGPDFIHYLIEESPTLSSARLCSLTGFDADCASSLSTKEHGNLHKPITVTLMHKQSR